MFNIKQFRKDMKIKQSEICEVLKISQPFLSAIERGFRPLNEIKFQKLYNHYGNIILKYKHAEMPVFLEPHDTVDDSASIKPSLISDLNVTVAPLISQYAQSGYLNGFRDPNFLDKQPKYVATQKYSDGSYIAFEVRGDSMEAERKDAICNGDVVLGREINKDNWTNVFYIPLILIIVHKDYGVLFREVIKHDIESDIITCCSYNHDKSRYPNFDLHIKDVQQLFYLIEQKRGYF